MKRQKNKSVNTLSTIKRVLGYLSKYKILFALSLLLTILVVAATLYVPILIGQAIDLAVGAGQVDFDGILIILIKIGVLSAINALVQWVVNVCNNRITFGIVRRLRRDAFLKIQELPLSYIDSHPTGDTVSRVISDVDQLTDGLLMGFSQLFTSVLTILGTVALMLSINVTITAVVVFITPLSLFVAAFIAKSTHSLFKKQSEIRAEQTSLIDEMIGEHKTVVAFSHEDEANAQFDEINARLQKCSEKAVFFSSLTNPCTRFVNNLVYAGVALVGAIICVSSGGVALTVGALVSLLNFANKYSGPFNEVSGVITELQNALTCAGRVFELIDAPAQTPDSCDAHVLKNEDIDGSVNIENASFSYTPDRELIKDLNLSIEKGQTEAGRSLGLSAFQTMVYIVIPQAVKNIFPTLCNEFIVLIKETAIVGYVGLMDIQKAGDFIKSATFEAFMPLIATAVIYFVLIKILTVSLGFVEKSLRKSEVR